MHQSINYANVAISLTNAEGVSQVYGYVPVVVAKCGVFLKDNGEPYKHKSHPFVKVSCTDTPRQQPTSRESLG